MSQRPTSWYVGQCDLEGSTMLNTFDICDPPRRNESHVAEVDFTGDRKNLITPRILHLHLWNWVDLSSNNSGSFWQDETSDSISEFAF